MRSWRTIIRMIGALASVVAIGVVSALTAIYFFGTPDAEELLNHRFSETSVFYDRTGEHVLYRVHGEENRTVIPHESIPPLVRLATLAAEDDNFYRHYGVDPFSIVRAVSANVRNERIVQGGSTITQQLARTVFLDRRKTLHRKVSEALLAIKLEQRFTKDEILDFYLNGIPYGSNAYGIESAAKTFFGKPAKDVTLDQAAFLAALPNAPTYYSPYGNHRRELVARQRMILSRMIERKMITPQDGQRALKTNTIGAVVPLKVEIVAPHFVFYVIEELEKKFGKDVLETGGWKIYTTLDYDLQKKAEAAVTSGIARNQPYNAENAALTAMDPRTGQVLAMVGSRNFFDTAIDGQVNVATRLRQPGSSFKPFAYAKAFEKGYQPETLLYDVPTNFGPDGSGKDYEPQNYDGRFHGLLPMRKTLSNSLNIPAVQTLYLAGVQETIDLAQRLGITTLQDRNRYGLSLVLGGGEVKLVDMVTAFSTFATEGIRHSTESIVKIIGPESTLVYETRPEKSAQKVLDPEVARKINAILSDNEARSMIFGSQTPLAFPGNTVAAKTGTTQEFRDAWTVGYTQSLAVGVWVGNNDNRPMKAGADGVFVAAPIWREFMDQALPRFPAQAFAPYTPVSSEKPLLAGYVDSSVRYFRKSSGKELSAEEALKKDPDTIRISRSTAPHSILYYVDRNDPLGSTSPNYNDPMLWRWEKPLGYSFDENEKQAFQ